MTDQRPSGVPGLIETIQRVGQLERRLREVEREMISRAARRRGSRRARQAPGGRPLQLPSAN